MKRIILLFISILFITGCNKEEKQLVCEKGNLINGKCEIVESIDVSLKCREGYTLNEETKKCENTITIAHDPNVSKGDYIRIVNDDEEYFGIIKGIKIGGKTNEISCNFHYKQRNDIRRSANTPPSRAVRLARQPYCL